MAAGQGFKTFATGDVLTAADTNGYLMQGVWVFANAAARTSAVTSPQEGNMSFLKDTNSTEYYDGAAWVAVAGAGGGGMTLLSTTTLSGTSTSITVAPTGYKDLKVYLYGCNNGTDYDFYVRLNSVTTTSYWESYRGVHGASTAVNLTASYNGFYLNGYGAYALKAGNTDNAFNMTIADCNSSQKKIVSANGGYMAADPGTSQLAFAAVGSVATTSAVTNITVIGSTSMTAGTCQIYGVK